MDIKKSIKDFESELNVNSEFFGFFQDELNNINKPKKESKKKFKNKIINKSNIESTSKTLNIDTINKSSESNNIVLSKYEINKINEIIKYFVNNIK
jgi:hypothetical protein